MPAPQVTLLESDADLGLFLASDIYRFDIDNRPLRNLLINDEAIVAVLNPLSEEVFDARTNTIPFSYANLKARLDDMDLNSGYTSKLVLFDLMNERARMYRAQFASGWFCLTGDVYDANDMEINWQDYGDSQLRYGSFVVKTRIPGETTIPTGIPSNTLWMCTQQFILGPSVQPIEGTVAGYHFRLFNESANGAAPSGFSGGISILFPAPPSTGQRFDFAFLEVWFAPVSKLLDGLTPTTGFYPYGSVDSNAPLVLDPTDPTVQGTVWFYSGNNGDYVQIRHRIRVVSNIDAINNPFGMTDHTAVLAQGGAGSPVGGHTYTHGMIALGDPSCWIAGDGSGGDQTALGSVDGHVYALPMCIASRFNTTAWSLSNPNGGAGRLDGFTATDFDAAQILDLRQRSFTDRNNIGQVADETFDRIMRGKLRTLIGEVVYDGVSSLYGAQDDPKNVYGTEPTSYDFIFGSKVAGTNTVLDFPGSGAAPLVAAPDNIRRIYSPAPGDTQSTGFHITNVAGGVCSPSNMVTYNNGTHVITLNVSGDPVTGRLPGQSVVPATIAVAPVMSWRGTQQNVKLVSGWSGLGTSIITATLDNTDTYFNSADLVDGAVIIQMPQSTGIRKAPNRVDYQEYVNPTSTVFPTTRLRGVKNPFGIAVDVSGNIYVCDTANHRVVEYGPTGTLLSQFGVTGVSGSDNTHLFSPNAVAIDSTGNVIICDSGNHRVVKATPSPVTMTYVSQFGTTGTPGTTNSQLNHPTGVAASHTGTLFISDNGNNRVLKITAGMTFLLKFPSADAQPPGNDTSHVYSPQQMCFGSDNLLYVADTIRVLVLDGAAMTLQKVITGGYGLPEGAQATALAGLVSVSTCEDASGNIYVASIGAIYKFDSSLNLLGRFGNPMTPWDGNPANDTTLCNTVYTVAFDASNNSIWCTDFNFGFNPFVSRILILDAPSMTFKYQMRLTNPRPWHIPNAQPPFPPPWAGKLALNAGVGRQFFLPLINQSVVEVWNCPTDNPSSWTFSAKYGNVSSNGASWVGWRTPSDNQTRLANPQVCALSTDASTLFIGEVRIAGGNNNQNLQVAGRVVRVTVSGLAYAGQCGNLAEINGDSGTLLNYVSGIVVMDDVNAIYISDPYSNPPRILVTDYTTAWDTTGSGQNPTSLKAVMTDQSWISTRNQVPGSPTLFLSVSGVNNARNLIYIDPGQNTQRWSNTSPYAPTRLLFTPGSVQQFHTQFEEGFQNVIAVYQNSNVLLIGDYIQNMIFALSTPDYYPIGKVGTPRVASFGGGGMALPTGVVYDGTFIYFSDQFNNHVVKTSPYFAFVERNSGRIETLFPMPVASELRVHSRYTPYQGVMQKPSFTAALVNHESLRYAGSRTIYRPEKMLITTRGRVDVETNGLNGDIAFANPLAHLPIPANAGTDYDWNGMKIPFDNVIGATDLVLLPIIHTVSSPITFAQDSESFYDPNTLFTTTINAILPKGGISTINGVNAGFPTVKTFNIVGTNFARLGYTYLVVEYLGELLLFVRGELINGAENLVGGYTINNVVEVFRMVGNAFVKHFEQRT